VPLRERTGGLPRAVSVRPFYFWLRSRSGVRPRLRPLLQNQVTNHLLLLIANCSTLEWESIGDAVNDRKSRIGFVLSPFACSSLKSAANCSSSNFIRDDAPQYPTAIEWIKTANKARRIRRCALVYRLYLLRFRLYRNRRSNRDRGRETEGLCSLRSDTAVHPPKPLFHLHFSKSNSDTVSRIGRYRLNRDAERYDAITPG
jgi:hypothetical protein